MARAGFETAISGQQLRISEVNTDNVLVSIPEKFHMLSLFPGMVPHLQYSPPIPHVKFVKVVIIFSRQLDNS